MYSFSFLTWRETRIISYNCYLRSCFSNSLLQKFCNSVHVCVEICLIFASGANFTKGLSLFSESNLRLLSQIIGTFFLSLLGSAFMDFTKGISLNFG